MNNITPPKNRVYHILHLIFGLLMIAISIVLAFVFYFQTGITYAPSIYNSSSVIKQQEEQEHQELLRKEGLEKINVIRREAALEFQELAAIHKQNVISAFREAIIEEISAAHNRVSDYVEWLISWEATWEMVKAWWDNDLDLLLIQTSEKRLLSKEAIHGRLQTKATILNQEAASMAEAIAIRYENRFASLLYSLDEPIRVQMPPIAFKTITESNINNPVITGNLAGMSSFIGATVLAAYGERRFIEWLGGKIAIKAGSKVVRVGTGPIGWAVSLGGGYLVEKGLDEYYLKPRLTEEINRQLDQIKEALLSHYFIAEEASTQALPFLNIAKELEQSLNMADLKTKKEE